MAKKNFSNKIVSIVYKDNTFYTDINVEILDNNELDLLINLINIYKEQMEEVLNDRRCTINE